MNCERIQDLFLDFEAGSLSDPEAAIVREHLTVCPACQREWSAYRETLLKLEQVPAPAPGERMRTQFYEMLDTHLRQQETRQPFAGARSRMDRWIERIWPQRPVFQMAAALALVAVALVLGRQPVEAPRSEAPETAARLAATQRELADLRAKIDSMNHFVTSSLASLPSAQNRLKQVVAASQGSGSSEQALAQLLNTLAFDPSTNVRLTALEALYARADETAVRQGVLAALGRESSPLVQVSMIDFLAAVREPEAAPAFQRLAQAPGADAAVRTAAQRALALL